MKADTTGNNMEPQHPKKKLSPELEDLRSEIEQMICPLKDGLNLLLEMRDSWETGLQKCNTLLTENKQLHARVEKVEKENKALNNRVRTLEDKLLEANVIFQGVPDSIWEPMETMKEKILTAISHTISGSSVEEKMDQARKIPIKEISRIGKYTAMRTRSVLVEFYYKSDAMFLLENRSHLPKGVFVDKQFSEETEKERRKLHPILCAARKSENYQGKCRMDGLTLVIKGRNYTSANLHTLPLEINGYMATSKCDAYNTTIGFLGELNPRSNFHLTPFKINGYQYHSSEQFIQQQKCKMFGDQETEALIMATESALECKQLSRDIKNFDPERWKQNAKASCTPGILAKLEQNEQLFSSITKYRTETPS